MHGAHTIGKGFVAGYVVAADDFVVAAANDVAAGAFFPTAVDNVGT